MPKLTRIRITGNKYDGFKKRHRDFIFSLSPDREGDHTLFTLQNGSGKGVMLQLISQLLLPGTAWGPNKGNKLEGMFYNRYNVFNPYTFHVVLEWKLDGEQDRWLLAGICVSGRWQTSTDEEEGKVGLQYFLYTHEYKREGKFRLDNLPLYDSTAGEPVGYDQFEAFIDDNHRDFRKYSKTSVSRLNSEYYQYLASHGIYRSEWEIMRTINRSEGGLDKYFARARDNQALFDKLLIPAVSESISYRNQDNENSLLNMFVSNIQIARDLPELLSRTDDIHQLLKMVDPLLLDAEQGVKLTEAKEAALARGNNLYRTIQDRETFLENELKKSQKAEAEVRQQKQELLYEEQNLKYARKLRELNQMQEKQSQLEDRREKFQAEIEQLQAEKKELRLNLLYLPYCQARKELGHKQDRIRDLKESLGLEDLRQEMVGVKNKLEKSWPQLEKELQATTLEVSSYKQHLTTRLKNLESREKELKENIRNRERKIDRFQQRQQDLKKKRDKLAEIFNPLQLSTPAYLVEQVTTDLKQAEDRLASMQENRQEIKGKIEELKDEQNQLRVELTRQESLEQGLQERYEKQKTREEEISGQLINLLDLDRFTEVYSQSWLAEKQLDLKKLLQEKEERLQVLRNKVHELELDLALNQADSWIANHDQKKMYRAISEMGIKVYYGSDFLFNLADDREGLISSYPLLPYGLVLMYEADWQRVRQNLSQEDIFRSPVPIFINFELAADADSGQGFKLVHGRELGFIERPEEYQEWYAGLEEEQSEIVETINVLENKCKGIRRLDYEVDQLLDGETADGIRKKLDRVEGEIEQLQKQIDEIEKKITYQVDQKKELIDKIERKEREINKLQEHYREVKEFAEESADLARRETEIVEVKERLQELEDQLERNESDRKENRNMLFEIRHQYSKWEQDVRRFLAEIREIVAGVELVEAKAEEPLAGRPDLVDYRDSKVNYYYQQLLDLERKEEDRSTELKYLRRELDKLVEQIQSQEEKLADIDPDWQDYELEESGQEQLRVRLDRVQETLTARQDKLSKIEKEVNILTGEIKGKKCEIDELFTDIQERFHKTARAWPEVDLDRKQLEIENRLQDNKKYLQDLADMIEEYEDKIHHIKNLAVRLKVYQLSPAKGEINSVLREKVRLNVEEVVEEWVTDYEEIEQKLTGLKQKTENDFNEFKRKVSDLLENQILRSKIKENIIRDFKTGDYNSNYQILSTFKEYLHKELNQLGEDKSKAERARKQWAERAAMHVMRIINSMQEMINNMVYYNQKGHAFPLVRLRRSDLLPEREEDIIPELKDYFVSIIAEFRQEEIEVERLTDSELEEYTGDAALFSRAVRGRYPVLEVYKMTEKNEFLYARPRDYYYADWEAVIQGKGATREGSGGQSLSINAFMMMMLLNYKKQKLDRSNPWTVLLLDNPFGQASAAHVLDPIFKIADKLNFQLIAFAAPEIVKTELSERFPVFWALEIADNEQGQGTVSGQVIYGERTRQE